MTKAKMFYRMWMRGDHRRVINGIAPNGVLDVMTLTHLLNLACSRQMHYVQSREWLGLPPVAETI